MEIRPEKVIDAIACLKVTADHLLTLPQDDLAAAMLAAKCIESAAALQASVQIAGLTHRTFHATGSLQ